MKKDHNKPFYSDVDDTLLMWGFDRDPKYWDQVICIEAHNNFYDIHMKEYLVPNEKNIQELINHSNDGWEIIVWSAAGKEWAEAAVKALKLEPYVDDIKCKPVKFLDDLKASEFMSEDKRIYHKFDGVQDPKTIARFRKRLDSLKQK